MSTKTIRWGLVGAGRIANTFVQDMSWVENARITAVAARSLDNAQQFADKHDIASAYQGYDTLFADPNIDAVYISTPHTLHFEQTRDALLAGKHVLCEKPFVVTPKQCETLTSLARDKGLFLMEAMWTWFLPAIKQAQLWVEQGRIGEITQIQADFGYPIEYGADKREWNVDLAGGCTFEMGIYPIAFNRLFHRHAPLRMSVIGKRADNGADKRVNVQFDFDTSSAVLGSSFESKLRNWAYIVGTQGYIAIPDFWRASSAELYELDNCIDSFVDNRSGSGFEFQIQHTVDSILSNKKESSVVTHADSLLFQQDIQRILTAF